MAETQQDGFYQASWAGVVAGFEVRDGRVTDETAPILKWARQKPAPTLDRWVRGKGGRVELITPFEKLF